MTRPLIVVFVGVPGSGKTTFARQLAAKLSAVILSSDSMRLSMWQSLEAIQASHVDQQERKAANLLTFGAMNYAARQVVASGNSVVYDANANSVAERNEKHDIARDYNALSVVVRIQVPRELSIQRLQERTPTHDSRQFSAEKATGVVDKFQSEIEEPHEDEHVIAIDGTMPFHEQYAFFCKEIATLES